MRIALYQGTSLISCLIRWQTRSQYSHAAFLLDDGRVVEAWAAPWPGNVREVLPMRNAQRATRSELSALSVQHTPGTVVDIFRFLCPLTPQENRRLRQLVLNDVGRPYDYLSIVRF